MIFFEPVAVGITQLRANKLRSFLTILGILIGVAAIVGIVSIGEGLRKAVMENFNQQGGADAIRVKPPRLYERKGGRWVRRTWTDPLTTDDLKAFFESFESFESFYQGVGLRSAVPEIKIRTAEISYKKISLQAELVGTSSEFHQSFHWPVEMGRPLTEEDVRNARKVCVIGQKIFKDLFPEFFSKEKNPVGEEIKLSGERFTVIGVLKERAKFGEDEGDTVFIPYTTAQKRFSGNRDLSGAMLFVEKAKKVEEVNQIADMIRAILERRHEHGKEFEVETNEEQIKKAGKVFMILKMVGGGIAGISLLVGGIGIMNIMLVSVTERTREIGIRKALGAKPRTILFQFIVEAVVLSLFGGVLGILVGVGFGLLIEFVIAHFVQDSPFSSIVSLTSILWATGFSVGVGVFFGVYPAYRASRFDPVEALRYE